ncbi:MAG: ParB/RepB/Spo0J family partition protein [Burkholderiales bacterium]|nr:ParB/RepB/Spo0J family partition protein [Burkholderiales bacterium]MCA3216580.1 ParB/RepB/Spo0J family partition protein [Burkholderiales bacterium]MCA3221926.1 ParB/RepB/Spo0J family partition protein [Burkholderiales bacterium]MCA3225199.1 ParB/RepB/Spo0J family partition protein [Burkholderiales bacterium]MCA3228068.1 ParB/RepB/Spo0J family partition protein [Burkholderiales bacterium]
MKRPKGLGRGLDALLGSDAAVATPAGSPQTLPLARLRAGKYQPRTRMNSTSLAELAESIKAQGVMQPILVRPVDDGLYEIIAGERRFRASQMAGLDEVPVLVKAVPDEAALAMALIENIQREDLNPLEEAQGVQRLIREFDFTHEQAAQAIGRSRSATSNLLRLLNLAPPVQEMLMGGQLDMGHARALLALDGAAQVQFGHQIVIKGLSVREAEALVARQQQPPGARKSAARRSRDVERLEEELADALGAVVRLSADAKGRGKLVIEFASLDQLDGIVQRLR